METSSQNSAKEGHFKGYVIWWAISTIMEGMYV